MLGHTIHREENTDIDGIVNRFRTQRQRIGRRDIRTRVATEVKCRVERHVGISDGFVPNSLTGRRRTCAASDNARVGRDPDITNVRGFLPGQSASSA
jgi:hypothetical protein